VLMSGLDLERLVLSGGPLGYVMKVSTTWKSDISLKLNASRLRLCCRIRTRQKAIRSTRRHFPVNARYKGDRSQIYLFYVKLILHRS
jgi:hypothetical protein